MNSDVLVSICCITYNHAPYIRQCLDGFIMQKTNFKYEILIHDDASTDGTADIIREYEAKYPDIFKPIYQTENQYSKGKNISATYNWPRAVGKYIAQCEGDDYWTDPLKLQKQVDFMEANPEYVLCCHRYKIYNQDDGTWDNDYASHILNSYPNGYVFTNKENLNVGWFTKTMTLLIRNDALKNMPNTRDFKYWRDFHMNYYLLKQGGGFCFPFDGAVYRRHDGSVHSSKSVMDKNKMAYCIAREVWDRNVEDKDLLRLIITLHPTFLEYLRYKIEKHNFKNLFKEILYFLRMDVKINGIKGVIFSIRKMLLSLCRLLKLK